MKKIYLLLLLFPFAAFATDYTGNGNNGFGGVIGQSTLTITDNATTINFSLAKGPAAFNDILVIYIDNLHGGGMSSTSGLLDDADALRAASSGYKNPNKTTYNFPVGFAPNYALAVGPSVTFAGLFQLVNGGANSLNYITSANLSPTSTTASTYTFNIPASAIGGTSSFRFIATYISNSAYLSDEAIGFTMPAGNPGFGTTQAPATYNTYTSLLPLSLLQFSGSVQGHDAVLNWRTGNESAIRNFIVEQSVDATNWRSTVTTIASNNPMGSSYSATTANLKSAVTYYRLRITSMTGEITYSTIIALKVQNSVGVILLGNIVKDQVRFLLNADAGNQVTAALYSLDGRLISSQQLKTNGAGTVCSLPAGTIEPGMYLLKVTSDQGTVSTFKLFHE